MTVLVSKNPSTGEILRELETTAPSELPEIFSNARIAQKTWSDCSIRERAQTLLRLRELMLSEVDEIATLIHQENGKPVFEAMVNEVMPCMDFLTYFAGKSEKVLRSRKIPMSHPFLKHRVSSLHYWPLGVVAIISPWNFPFLLPFADIVMALVAGNAVVFKPSEATPLVGLKIQELWNKACLPAHLLQTVVGDGSVGEALIHQKPNKIFFTGSVATGKKVMAVASQYLIPVNLELGGKDAMVVCADADVDYATSAALWGGFSNSGQACASVERIFVHESICKPFLEMLKSKVEKLRSEQDSDLGVITLEKQKQIYEQHLEEARSQRADFVLGGKFDAERKRLSPTIITGSEVERLQVFREETFGPIVAVTSYRETSDVVKKVNESTYGLAASVITRNLSLGREVANQLEVGTVTINEVLYTPSIPETPWGGIKESGFGRTHADIGLYEFVHVRHIHEPRWQIAVYKSWWWFPYGPLQFDFFRGLFGLYRSSWIMRLKTIPSLIGKLLRFLWREKRL
jgi:acyl-CoA reductase-like NAD-dependent aldehyde dehydrogenase